MLEYHFYFRNVISYQYYHPSVYSWSSEFFLDDRIYFLWIFDILQFVFQLEGIDINKKLIFSCGTGVTACIAETAAKLVGAKHTSVYDGANQEFSKYGNPDFEDKNWADKYPK